MSNLSQKKRQRMLEFLSKIKEEHKNDDEMLIALGEIENELISKKYGLVWEEHEENVDVQMRTNIPVFTEVKEREITAAPDEGYNFILEGDNLHSLYLLEKTHKGKIDLIYIDPPYNTGHEDFIYDDKYVDDEDSFKHSKWLSFMEKRLRITRNLLSEQGVIFIQISDIELAQLKILCDDIFDEGNFLNVISVNMKNIAGASGGGEDKRFKKNCEYILIYAKNYDLVPLFRGVYDYEELGAMIERYRTEGISWKYTSVLANSGEKVYLGSTVDGDGNEIKIYRRNHFKICSVSALARENDCSEMDIYRKYAARIFQTAMPQSSIRPRVMAKVQELGDCGELYSIEYIPKTGKNKGRLYEQFYRGENFRLFAWLSDVLEKRNDVLYKKTLQGTYWNFVAGTKNLTKEGAVEFANGKKPVDLLKQIISLYPSKNICVLDFFAGSATTGHAVLSLNHDDQGERQFILCTNNENAICDEKTYPRMKNVIGGYGKFAPIPANLKYYRTDFVPRYDEELSERLNEHIVEMIQLEHGVDIDGKEYIMVLNDAEMDDLEKHWSDYPNAKALYISQNVMMTTEQTQRFAGVEIHIIPDYYFKFELKESGEIW